MELGRQEAEASSSQRRSSDGDGGDRGGFDRSVEVELMSVDQCGAVEDGRDSHSRLVGVPVAIAAAGGGGGGAGAAAVKLAEKRKRGRPPRGQGKRATTAPPSRRPAAAKEEEDVCFICFDGGSLVLCDRRNCPKAYHPACIKRDEAFFRSRAKWNCGWHICSTCQKASYYMCYTCTYSLCKGCTKGADYVCVRGNKGFCGTCMRTILLIEKFEGNKEAAQVDFDDKSSWEYLFKVYWVLLKGSLSLTLDELLKAKNPWKGPPVAASNWGSSGGLYGGNVDKITVSGNSCPDLEVFNAKRRKINTKTNILVTANSLGIEKCGGDTVTHLNGDTSWASKELLEFVAYMRNGDASVMSQFDVQNLLLEYIKRNKLRDPHKKCQIVCDSRLLSIFGQARLGHIEMLKLLESHFLIKENSPVNNTIMARLVDAVGSQMESGWSDDSQLTMVTDKRRKLRKRVDEKGLPTNPDAYATIDIHNINLIYMRRSLLENLVDDAEKFHEKVVGSIVRIRICSGDQKPYMHRLVRVVGTSKGTEPYKIGRRETNVMLEVLNLDKKEVISIDGISNQEFSQDECERLRQSIKFGLIKRLTVGEIQEKAIALQELKVNEWLESEISRLNHLRDRASEKGHRKELREFGEKLELLNSPEERNRRLKEVPVVHTDPSMDPSYDFDHSSGELNQKKQDNKVKPRNSGVGRKRRESISPGWGSDVLINSASNAKNKTTPAEQSRESEMLEINGLKTVKNGTNPTSSGITGWSNQGLVGSDSYSDASEVSLPLSTGTNQSVDDYEMHKIWHYQDPTGKIQGPFSMLQLRKWSTTGHFPSDLRIWRMNEKQEDSILLTDALNGQYSKEQLLPLNRNSPLQEDKVLSDDRKNNVDGGEQSKSMDATPVNGEGVEQSRNLELDDPSKNLELDDPSKNLDGSNEAVDSDGLCSNPSSSTVVAVANSSDGHSMNFSEGWDSLKGSNIWPTQPQASSSLSAPVFPEKQRSSHQIGEDCVIERNSDQSDGNLNPWQNADCEPRTNQGTENRSDGEGHLGQSSGQNWRPPVSPTNDRDSNSGINSVAKSLETSEQNQAGIDFPSPPNFDPKLSNESPDGQAAENRQSVQDAGLSWSTASSLVGGSAQLHEVAGDSGGYSPGAAKPSVEEWESSLVSASSLKPREISDHAATPASISDHLTPSSPSHPHSNTSSWHDLVPDPDEFNSLMNESVSDLLAEVEAMESLHALSCHKVTEGSKTDCISPVEGFSPAPEPGKGDALSSTADIHLPQASNIIDEPLEVGNADVLNLEKSFKGHPAISPEVEGDTKHSDVSVNQWEASADIQRATPTTAGWDLEITNTTWSTRSESMDTNWGAVQTNAHVSWEGGLNQGNAVMDWGRPAAQQNPNVNSGGILGSQPKNGGDRYSSQRDRAYHARDSGFGRNRHAWNRQPYFVGSGGSGSGGSNGGALNRAPPKGQRVCKFYESGYCKKGASCSYFHP